MNSLVRFGLEFGGYDTSIFVPNRYLGGNYSSGNPTCAYVYGKMYMNSRLVNYKKILQSEHANVINDNKNQTYYLNESGFDSRNLMFEYNDTTTDNYKEIKYRQGNFWSFYRGFEDCRFIVWDDVLYAYGTRWDVVDGKGVICIYKIDENLEPTNEIIVKSPIDATCEKNWAAIEDMPFCFIYKANATTVVRVLNDGTCILLYRKDIDDRFISQIKGSTPVLRYNDKEYISLVHQTIYSKDGDLEKSTYVTAFIFYDNEFNITRMSDWFVFRTPLCEFTCGICIHDGKIYIPYSQVDCTVNMLEFPVAAVEAFMCGGDWPTYDRDYIYDLAELHETMGQYFTSSVLHNYAATMSAASDKIKLECITKAFIGLIDELPVITSNSHSDRLIYCISLLKNEFGDVPELNYLLSIIYKFSNKMNLYEECLKSAHESRHLLPKYFETYVNINYL